MNCSHSSLCKDWIVSAQQNPPPPPWESGIILDIMGLVMGSVRWTKAVINDASGNIGCLVDEPKSGELSQRAVQSVMYIGILQLISALQHELSPTPTVVEEGFVNGKCSGTCKRALSSVKMLSNHQL